MAEVGRLIRLMRLPAGLTRSRRARAGGRDRLDIRRLLRRSLRFGGELLVFSWKSPTLRPRPLVLLCDISGSMERYTRLLLNFAYALKNASTRVEAFVFATRLTRITRLLRSHDVDAALNRVMASVDDWSGGTRIGEAIETVISTWGSAPRPAGSRMAISQSGKIAGSISGGCLEGEVFEQAQAILKGKPASLFHYGVSDDLAWTVGLSCGGEIDVLVEPLGPAHRDLMTALAAEHPVVLKSDVGESPGARQLLTPADPTVADLLNRETPVRGDGWFLGAVSRTRG